MSTPSNYMYELNGGLKTLIYKVRELSIFPTSVFEFVSFIILAAIVIVIILLFHYHSIQANVMKTSRCMRDRLDGKKGGKFVVRAYASDGMNELYRVSYDFKNKTVGVECACKEGKVVNKFPDIPMYNIRTKSYDTVKEKICECDQSYDISSSDQIYHRGYPGLASFMNSQGKDRSFFENVELNGRVV